jgi:hypothetical protein
MNRSIRTLFSPLVALGVPVMLAAQGTQAAPPRPSAPTRVPLTIVLVSTLPHPGAPYEIQRRTSGDVRDVVLLLESATAEQLSDAIRGVLTARLVSGDTATQAAVIRVRPHAAGARQAFPWTHRVLADLRRAQARPVPGVGTVQAVRIWLPPQHGAGRKAAHR